MLKKNETFSGKDIDWINGFYGEDGTITPHTLYKHTRVFKVEPETKVTYAYLRSPTDYSPYIACFKNGVYIKKSSLLGDVDANFNNRSKNSLTSIGDGMNCTFGHVCSNS